MWRLHDGINYDAFWKLELIVNGIFMQIRKLLNKIVGLVLQALLFITKLISKVTFTNVFSVFLVIMIICTILCLPFLCFSPLFGMFLFFWLTTRRGEVIPASTIWASAPLISTVAATWIDLQACASSTIEQFISRLRLMTLWISFPLWGCL